jgi:2-polyprenyl-6-methoxyphenol hydroxylase-like FAD-dependent oxidoreductase
MLLGRLGYRVLLVDKATFPSDVPRCHFIQPPGVAQLQHWGLLDNIKASHCPSIPSVRFDVDPFVLASSPLSTDGGSGSYSPRRTVLDKILVDAAARAGVEVREGFSVQEVLMDGDRVTGIRGSTRDGATVTEKAGIVVGADGMRSIVARTVQAPMYNTKPTLTCSYFAYWSGVPVEGIEIYVRERRVIFAFPTNDDLTCIAMEWPTREFQVFRADIEGNFLKTIALAPSLAERVQAGRREERFMGSGDLRNFYRKPYGPGWVLVGDAGYHKDPYLAHGITDAFRDAELMAETIDAGLSGRRGMASALGDYERQRNEETLPIYELNAHLARLGLPSSEMQKLLGTLHGNQAETNRFFGVLAGTVPLLEFFASEHIEQGIAGGRKSTACGGYGECSSPGASSCFTL